MFINKGTDERILKSLDAVSPSDNLVKAMHKQGLVQVDKQVRTKNGSFIRKQWVRPDEIKATHIKQVKQESDKSKDKSTSNTFDVLDSKNMFMSLKTGKVETQESMLTTYKSDKGVQKKYKTFESYVKDNYFVSDGTNSTCDMYRVSWGRYTEQRYNGVHKPIIKKMLAEADTPPKDIQPVCFLYGGGSGSGKSTVVSKVAKPIIESTGFKFAHVDCDAIKEMLPEHKMFKEQNPNTAAMREHRESSDLTNEIIDAMISEGKCFQYDGTMSDLKKYTGIINKLKSAGYQVHIVATDIPVEMAIERAHKRDRQINDSIVHRTHREFGENFLEIAALDGVDSWCLYDNSQPEGEPNRCIVDQDGIQNDDLFDRFMNKAFQ